ncbi:MAG: prepilin peptidase [Acidobacteriaceae bacterium]|nr:prepilin peptidase [Acidobacteriaceae bacterium]
MWALGFTYELVRKREGLGFGDVKLLALIGSFLGVENGIFAMMIGAVSGAILGLAYIIIWRRKASEYHLPFGSFLCVGAAILPLLKTS